jgi:hypothetical protein
MKKIENLRAKIKIFLKLWGCQDPSKLVIDLPLPVEIWSFVRI